MRKSISIVFLLSVIFISLGLGCYMRSNNGRLLQSMYEGMKPKMESSTDIDEDMPLNIEDESIAEPTPPSEANLACELNDSPLNEDESKDVESKEKDEVEPFGTIDNSNYTPY